MILRQFDAAIILLDPHFFVNHSSRSIHYPISSQYRLMFIHDLDVDIDVTDIGETIFDKLSPKGMRTS